MIPTLPDTHLEKNYIGDMPLNRTFYTVPWAMSVALDGHCYLNPEYLFHEQPGGTVEMRILRTNRGYSVWLPRDYKFQKRAGVSGLVVTELTTE